MIHISLPPWHDAQKPTQIKRKAPFNG